MYSDDNALEARSFLQEKARLGHDCPVTHRKGMHRGQGNFQKEGRREKGGRGEGERRRGRREDGREDEGGSDGKKAGRARESVGEGRK